MTSWTYEEIPYGQDGRTVPAVDIHIVPVQETHQVRMISLRGCHVMLDVSEKGEVLSIEIIGPAVDVSLKNLGDYLGEPATVLGEEEKEET
jgi:hypothetical protein